MAPRSTLGGAGRGALLAVETFGQGETLVLMHGLATTREIWGLVVPTLAQARHVVTLDVPGFGESVAAGPGFELEAVAERIARGLAAHGVRGPFDLVGHSLGAGLALTLAAARPRAVRRLVLVAPAGLTPLAPPARVLLAAGVERALAARRALAPLAEVGWGRRLLLAFAAADGSLIAPSQARQMLGYSAGATRTGAALAAIAGADLRPLLMRTDMPLGMIWGTKDRTVSPRTARSVQAARPDAQLVMIERAGHVVMVERPDAFVSALAGLLGRLPKH
jgi:pimeloyl-ACP methyl ester carboxylesterase